MKFQRLYPPTRPADGPAHWLVFKGADVVLPEAGVPELLPGTAETPADLVVGEALLLGTLDGVPALAGQLAGEVPAGYRAVNLRLVLGGAGPELAGLAGYAAELLHWARTSRFCPACGTPLAPIDGWGRGCPSCKHTQYPPVSPATIVLIHDGERILLTTKDGWGKRYGLVAGFVEPGESFEECVVREVREEVGVELADIQYIASQPWPFPHQVMVGFMARYAGGEIVIDTHELAGAAWFTRDTLPELPAPFSIARQLIERWRAGS